MKWVLITRSSALTAAAAILVMEMLEVFVARIALGEVIEGRREKMSSLSCRIS